MKISIKNLTSFLIGKKAQKYDQDMFMMYIKCLWDKKTKIIILQFKTKECDLKVTIPIDKFLILIFVQIGKKSTISFLF